MTIQKSEASVPDSLAAYRQPDAGPSSALQRFNADGAAAMSIAVNLADTPFVPTSYKKRGERWLERQEVAANVAAAWLAGEEIGLRPMQALQAATGWAAECVGRAGQIGTATAGALADLVLVDGDPLRDVALLQDLGRIRLVLKGGEIAVDRRGGGSS